MSIVPSNMKTLNTFVKDVYALFGSGHKPQPENVESLAKSIAVHVENALAKREPRKTLRGSNIGTKCKRKLWYEVNQPHLAEPLEPWVLHKFLYGNIIEEILLFLGIEAGHSVEKRQERVEVKGIVGHIDAVVDGVVSDVKSASGYGMGKFKDHRLEHDDPFGYLPQITFYKEGLRDDPSVSIKGEAAFIAVDKSNGQIVVDKYPITEKATRALVDRVEDAISVVNSSTIPDRSFVDLPDGAYGNRVLCTECSYCPYKHSCWSGLRTFLYSTGPRFLTKVEREPNVQEVRSEAPKPENTNRDSSYT